MGAHVHVGADDAAVEEEQGVGVLEAAAVELVEGGLQEVDGVTEFTGQVVGHGTTAQRGDPGGEGMVGQTRLGTLEIEPPHVQLPRLQGAFAEPEQRGGPFPAEPVPFGLREQGAVLLGRLLRRAGGEGALCLGQTQPQIGGEAGRAAGGEFVEGDTEPLGQMPQRVVGGAHPAGLQGGYVGGRVRGLRQLLLGQPAFGAQLLHPATDRGRVVSLRHRPNSPCASCR